MDKIGVIGNGFLGGMLLNRLLASKAINADKLIVSTLFHQKLNIRGERFPGLEICDKNSILAEKCNKILICAKPLDVKGILEEILHYLRRDVHLISLSAAVSIGQIESLYTGKISRVIPGLMSEVDKGFILVCHNPYVENEDAEYIGKLFNTFGSVKIINENHIDLALNLTAAARELIGAIFREFVNAGEKYGHLTREEVEEMVTETFYGTSKLFHEKIMKFPETISQVATKGGITEVGDALLREKLPEVLDQLLAKTREKHEGMKAGVTRQFIRFLNG